MPRAFTQHSVCRLQSHYGCSCSSFAFIVLTHSIVLISQPIYSAVGRHLYPFQTLTVMNLAAVYIRCCPHLSFLLVHTGLHFYWACSQLYNRSARVELHMVFQSGSINLSFFNCCEFQLLPYSVITWQALKGIGLGDSQTRCLLQVLLTPPSPPRLIYWFDCAGS